MKKLLTLSIFLTLMGCVFDGNRGEPEVCKNKVVFVISNPVNSKFYMPYHNRSEQLIEHDSTILNSHKREGDVSFPLLGAP